MLRYSKGFKIQYRIWYECKIVLKFLDFNISDFSRLIPQVHSIAESWWHLVEAPVEIEQIVQL